MIKQIDLTIYQDWSVILERYQKISQVIYNNDCAKKNWNETMQAWSYDFGSNGSFMSYDKVSEPGTAGSITGTLITAALPWVDQLRADLEGLRIVAIGLQCNTGPISNHVDGHSGDALCKLNHVINDCDFMTYASRDGVITSYPSKANTSWLLDTSVNHWVDQLGTRASTRYCLQISFNEKFDDVALWFEQHAALCYGQVTIEKLAA